VFEFLSNNNIVIPPAKTGNDNNSKIAVIKIAQTNKGILLKFIVTTLMFIIVTIKFIAPKRDEIPAKCNENITISTELPARAIEELKGG
jgi:hypothetical protein